MNFGKKKALHPGMIFLLGKHQFLVSSIDDTSTSNALEGGDGSGEEDDILWHSSHGYGLARTEEVEKSIVIPSLNAFPSPHCKSSLTVRTFFAYMKG